MGGWGNATRQGTWNTAGWGAPRGERPLERPKAGTRTPGRWTALDIGLAIGAFLLSKELCAAFVALKLWHQASNHDGSVLAFASEKWETLVRAARRLMAGRSVAMPFVSRTSGNHAFDAWRETELSRIEAERNKLHTAEREFAAYRDKLLYADRDAFDRFMQAKNNGEA